MLAFRPLAVHPILVLSLTSAVLSGCAKPAVDEGSGAISSKAEPTYCSTVSVVTSGTTITSLARYQAWTMNTTNGLTSAFDTNPIRRAEVQVVSSDGSTVQCGETDNSGNISISIPRVAGTYTLKVFSRADNTFYKASVLNNPTQNEPYAISASFTLNGSETSRSVTLTNASHTGTLEGGAFNILDQILKANDFMRTTVTNALCTPCADFTVAPKAKIFWTAGVSPGVYYGSASSPISFFSKTDTSSIAKGIYILGGVLGDVNCTDTDHFDNSIILHEYGHFLEDAYNESNSPGGSHNGNSLIDPRLAWSEGWSNFYQAAVLGRSDYIDTTGNAQCSGGIGIDLNLELATGGEDRMLGGTVAGEGVFREVSVSRTLYDIMTPAGSTNELKTSTPIGADLGFGYIWHIFSSASDGLGKSSYAFRNMGNFNRALYDLIAVRQSGKLSDLFACFDNEYQTSGTGLNFELPYATPVTTSTSACSRTIGTVSGSINAFQSTHSYTYNYDGNVANATITLTTSSGTVSLAVYPKGYASYTSTTPISQNNGSSTTKSISLSGQPAGTYLIRVQASIGTGITYNLTRAAGSYLCPN